MVNATELGLYGCMTVTATGSVILGSGKGISFM